MQNRTLVTGRLTADPELRHLSDGTAVVLFTVATPRIYSKKDEADFIDAVTWRKTAEFVCENFHKGKWIDLDGRIQTLSYTGKNDVKRKVTEIQAEHVSFVGDKSKEPGTAQQQSRGDGAPQFSSDFVPDFSVGGGGFDFSAPPPGDGDLPF